MFRLLSFVQICTHTTTVLSPYSLVKVLNVNRILGLASPRDFNLTEASKENLIYLKIRNLQWKTMKKTRIPASYNRNLPKLYILKCFFQLSHHFIHAFMNDLLKNLLSPKISEKVDNSE